MWSEELDGIQHLWERKRRQVKGWMTGRAADREGCERVKEGIAEEGGAAGGRQTEEGRRAPLLETDYVSGLGGGYTHLDRKRSRCTHCPANKEPRKRSRTDIFDFSQPA